MAECLTSDNPMRPPGFQYGERDGFWEVAVCPTPVELLGETHDGAVLAPDIALDPEQLPPTFERTDDCGQSVPACSTLTVPSPGIAWQLRACAGDSPTASSTLGELERIGDSGMP